MKGNDAHDAEKDHKKLISFAVSAVISASALALPSDAAYFGTNHFLAEFTQSVYDDSNGMDSAEVNDLYQSSDGYIWIATYGGVLRYDGSEFFHIDSAKNGTVPRVSAMALCEDENGSMWIGTNGNGILIFSREHVYELIGKDKGLPSLSVRTIVKSPDGSMLIGTTGGVCRIDMDKNVTVYSSTENMFIRDITVDEGGTAYAVTDTGDFITITADGEEHVQKFDYDFSCVRLTGGGMVQLGTVSHGMLDAKLTDEGIEKPREVIPNSQTDEIKDIICDRDDNIWVVSQDGIGLLWNGRTLLKIENLKISSNFSHAIQDSDGGYWIGSDKYGILKLVSSEFNDFSFEYNLPKMIVNAIVKYNSDYYLGTDDGLIVISRGEPVETELTKLLDGVRVRCLYTDAQGNLRIATYGEETGLVTLKSDGTYSCLTTKDGLPNSKIRTVSQLHDGRIIVGTADGAAIVENEKVVKTYTNKDGLPNTVILCTCEDTDGTIYFGTDGGGIFAVNGDTTDLIDEEDGLDGEVILRLKRDDENGVIWVSTGNTVCCIKDKKVQHVDCAGIYNNVFDFIISGNKVWLTTANAIYSADAADMLNNDGNVSLSCIDRSCGLSSAMCSNSWNYLDVDGRLYLCCIEGVSSFDTLRNDSHDNIPNIVVSGVEYGDETVYGKSSIIVPSTIDRLTINLSVINFVPSGGTSVLYQLVGQDEKPLSVNSNDLKSVS